MYIYKIRTSTTGVLKYQLLYRCACGLYLGPWLLETPHFNGRERAKSIGLLVVEGTFAGRWRCPSSHGSDPLSPSTQYLRTLVPEAI